MTTSTPDEKDTSGLIFVSYAREDARAVLPIVERLRIEGLTLWIDLEGIEGAAFWRGEIVQAIERSRVVLFFASRASCASDNISKELALANEDRKPILPVFLDDATLPSDLRYQLAGLQRIAWHQDQSVAYAQTLLALRRLLNLRSRETSSTTSSANRVTRIPSPARRTLIAGTATTIVLGGAAGIWQMTRTGRLEPQVEVLPSGEGGATRSASQRPSASPSAALRAVVIGNQNYALPQIRLKNPISDAKAVAQFLRRQDFTVTELFDLTSSEAKDRIAKFYVDSSTRTRGLTRSTAPALWFFFYSGHAVSYGNQLCIVPVDVDTSKPENVKRYIIPVTDLLASKFGIEPRNQLTLYAAAPGQLAFDSGANIGSNSPFTDSFIRHLQNPALDVSTLFSYVTRDVRRSTNDAQTPWVEGSLDAPLFLGDMKRTNLEGNTLISVVDACRDAPFTTGR